MEYRYTAIPVMNLLDLPIFDYDTYNPTTLYPEQSVSIGNNSVFAPYSHILRLKLTLNLKCHKMSSQCFKFYKAFNNSADENS